MFSQDSITIETHVKYPIDQQYKLDTIMNFARQDLLDKLAYEKQVIPMQLVIAGGYQTITLNTDQSTIYQVRKAAGLLSLIENGKSNVAVYSK